jgi:hypothetical protein
MDENEVILSRIQKLLRLSTSSNPNEAAVAAGKAQELLLKYNLSMTQVEGYSAEKQEPIIEDMQRFGKNLVDWKFSLAAVVARNNLCHVHSYGSSIVWVGRNTNMQVARFLTDTLIADLERLATEYWNGVLLLRKLGLAQGESAYIHGRVYKSGFYSGAVETIRERLRASKQSLTVDPNMNALVVREDNAVGLFVKSHYNLHYNSGYLNTNAAGFAAGREAGGLVNFKTGVGAGGSSAPKMIR